MRQDEFTKSLKGILGSYGTEYSEIAGKLTRKIFEYMQAGDSVARAYKKAIKEIPFGKLNASAVEDAVYEAALKGYGITAPEVFAGVEGETALRHSLMEVAWHKDGMKLSTRLHGVDNVLRNNIKDTVQRSLNAYKTIQQTAKALYDGYGNPEDVLDEAKLPKYLEKVKSLAIKLYSGDVEAAKQSDIYKAAVHDLNKLKTPGMRAAYNDVVEAATGNSKGAERKARKMTKLGASQEEIEKMLAAEREKALEKALDVAAQEKTRYYAERIARTESARAYYEGQLAEAEKDDDVFGFQWRLSSAHVHKAKDCDCHMYADLDIGYGKGIYPKADVPKLPAHPNCMCHLKKVFSWEVKKTNGKDKLPPQEEDTNRVAEAAEELQNEEAHKVVNGENVSGKWERRPEQFKNEIDDIVDYQGFNGYPRIVSKAEFDKLVEDDHFIAQRVYSAESEELLAQYANELRGGEWYITCKEGGAQYGQGMYCAADFTKGSNLAGVAEEMEHYANQYKNAGKPYSRVETMTMDKSAKIYTMEKKGTPFVMQDVAKEYVSANPGMFGIDSEFIQHPERLAAEEFEAQSALYKKAYNEFGNEILHKRRDMGAVMAELGYDAINAVGHGKSGSYVVILNRTKVILLGED